MLIDFSELLSHEHLRDNMKICEKALIKAVKQRQTETVKKLLNQTVLSDYLDYFKLIELRASARYNHLDFVKKILSNKDIINRYAYQVFMACVEAAKNNHLKIVRYFLTIPTIKKNIAFSRGLILIVAVKSKANSVIEELIKCNEIIDQCDITSGLSLEEIKNKLLLTKNEVKNIHYDEPYNLCTIVKTSSAEEVKNYLKDKEQVNELKKMASPFLYAIRFGKTENFCELLKYVPVPLYNGEQDILEPIAQAGHVEMLRILLKNEQMRKTIIERGKDLLSVAVSSGSIDIIRELLKYKELRKIFLDCGSDLLTKATFHRSYLSVMELLSYPEVRRNASANKNEALRTAIEAYSVNIVNELIEIPNVRKNITLEQFFDVLVLPFSHAEKIIHLFEDLKVKEFAGVSRLQNIIHKIETRPSELAIIYLKKYLIHLGININKDLEKVDLFGAIHYSIDDVVDMDEQFIIHNKITKNKKENSTLTEIELSVNEFRKKLSF